MAHDPRAVANWLIGQGISDGHPLTHIAVQKLMYFAHGWMLSIHDAPLIDQEYEAWKYGPVVPSVYHNLKHHRGQPIRAAIPTQPTGDFTPEEEQVLKAVYQYRTLGVFKLVGISHARGGPWDDVWHGDDHSKIINNDRIRSYFLTLLNRETQEETNG